jgi:gas vesicle protein
MKADKIIGVLGGVASRSIISVLFAPEKGDKTKENHGQKQ